MRKLRRGSKNEDINQRSNYLVYPKDVYDDEELQKGFSYKDFKLEANDNLLDDLKSFRNQIGTIEGLATKLSTKLERRNDSLDSDLLKSLSNFVSDCEGLWDTLAERILSEDPDWDS